MVVRLALKSMTKSAADAALVDLPVKRGDVIGGKYRLEDILGMGGTAVVMSATHLQLQQKFAVKLLLPKALEQGVDHLERLLREARVIAQMKSPHVARVVDVGTMHDGAPFMVMELLEGADLEAHLTARGRLSVGEAVDYVMQVCEAVAEAHSLGVIHRDIKPANIFITYDVDRRPLVKVLDFGLSKLGLRAAEQAHRKITQPLEVMGTPAYMSPEQLRATTDVDERSDIWSIGVVLYELLNGSLPFSDASVQELCAKVMRDAARPHAVELPPGLETALQRCLQKSPNHRFPNVSSLAVALAHFATNKTRLERVLRVQPLSPHADLELTGPIRPENLPPLRAGMQATQVPVVTELDLHVDHDDADENPFAKKRGGLVPFAIAGAIAGAAILAGVAFYAGQEAPSGAASEPPASASTSPPAEPTPSSAAANTEPAPATNPSLAAPMAAKAATASSAQGGANRRTLRGIHPRAGEPGTPSGTTSSPAGAAKAPTDPDKLLETR